MMAEGLKVPAADRQHLYRLRFRTAFSCEGPRQFPSLSLSSDAAQGRYWQGYFSRNKMRNASWAFSFCKVAETHFVDDNGNNLRARGAIRDTDTVTCPDAVYHCLRIAVAETRQFNRSSAYVDQSLHHPFAHWQIVLVKSRPLLSPMLKRHLKHHFQLSSSLLSVFYV